ncbi:DUF4255 domain-containing protein [Mycobacterium sp. PS03-16]|uniref:DUF4255 domain-containing protein n=1 Tax=Mycobacterium sp. PS03-16 TaxID=2559611 RepID=UPI00107309D6|nr:DUF4255 domain-containing protein [Mycobacterium sp. PS03-16]TFV58167.1 DUF4255 domain-containing protein [Mycobacterium sp. PS03-16]
MIPEVDRALRTLIEREALDREEVEVAFDAPTKEWAARRNSPTVDVYLYDIREDLRRRERGWLNEYDGELIRARHLPPRHFKLSYLVAAWTQRPEDEHRLLAALLSCFLRHEALPTDVLTGSLAALGLPVPVSVALPPPEDRSFADVWTALGGELKPSLDVVVTAPADTGRRFEAAPAVRQPISLTAGGIAGWPPSETRSETTETGSTATEPEKTTGADATTAIRRTRRAKPGRSR